MDRREFTKMGALAGSGIVIGAVITKCGEDILSPEAPKVVGLDLTGVDLSQNAYKKWLRNFKPHQTVGTRGSEIDCPTARFVTFQGKLTAIVLGQQHAFAGGVILANPIWLRDYVKKLDASGPDGSPITRLEAQKLL